MYTIIFCVLLGLFFLSHAMGLFSSRNHFPVEGKTILLTGASSGLGLSLAHALSSRGAHLILVSSTPSKLSSAITSVKSSARSPSTQRFHALPTDLRSSSATEKLLRDATDWNGGSPPDIVWCCAGHCIPGFFADLSLEELKGQMETVYWSCANTAHATLRMWLKYPVKTSSKPTVGAEEKVKEERHLVFTASTAAFTSIAGYGAYSPAKRAIHALSDTLLQEFEMYNAMPVAEGPSRSRVPMRIQTVFPMGILSPGFQHEQTLKPLLTQRLEESDKPQTPEEVAKAALKGLENGEYLITTMAVGHLLRGVGTGGSLRNGWGVLDGIWGAVGWIALALPGFGVMRGFLGECRRWGRENPLRAVVVDGNAERNADGAEGQKGNGA